MTQEAFAPCAVGLRPLLAKVELCLKMHRGSLPYDRTLGSTLYLLRPADNVRTVALRAAQQAVQRIGGVQVQQVQTAFSDTGAVFTVLVQTACGNGSVTVPVLWEEGEET